MTELLDVLLMAQQAYALALAGRIKDALTLVNDGARTMGDQAPPDTLAALFLIKAHLLLATGDDADRRTALDALTRLERQSPSAIAAVAHVERARALGHTPDENVTNCRWLKRSLRSEEASETRTAEGVTPDQRRDRDRGDQPSAGSLLRLVEFGRRLAAETEPRAVLRTVLHEAIETTQTERGFVALVRSAASGDAQAPEIEIFLAENVDWSSIASPNAEMSRSLLSEVVRTGEPRYVGPARASPRSAHPALDSLIAHGVSFAACVPIVDTGTVMGALYLDRCAPAPQIDARRMRWLEMFATQAGAALVNARLHQRRARQLQVAQEAARRYRSESEMRRSYGELIGVSEAMQAVYRQLDRIVASEVAVLIIGETGTGKELAARVVHERGPRAERPFIAVNCAGVPDALLEDELFGHEPGAFSGAETARPGVFELADGGTLFLDEIAEMSARMQASLLRVLESGELRRLGGHDPLSVDVRVIAATHGHLPIAIAEGRFRADLYYRLNVISLELPPLRDRPEDVPLLVHHLLRRLGGPEPAMTISDAALRQLSSWTWPGNVRQLENLLKRLHVLGVPRIEPCHLEREEISATAPSITRTPSETPHRSVGTLRDIEAQALRRALETCGGNRSAAARQLGIDRRTLARKLHRLRLDRDPGG